MSPQWLTLMRYFDLDNTLATFTFSADAIAAYWTRSEGGTYVLLRGMPSGEAFVVAETKAEIARELAELAELAER